MGLLLSKAVAARYAVLGLVSAGTATWVSHVRKPGLDDWLYFEIGARTIAHTSAVYSGGALHLYANNPGLQIGPPPFLALAAFQWLPPAFVTRMFVLAMALSGVVVVWCAERLAHLLSPARTVSTARRALLLGILFTVLWSVEAAQWRHLDDVMAITGLALASVAVARSGRWWLAGLAVGLAVAAKPWAIIAAPVLLALPRPRRASAALVALVTAAAFWLPFVAGDPRTVAALGQVRLGVSSSSTLSWLGISAGSIAPGWVRAVQLVGGFGLMCLVARRARWTAVPMLALLFRVVTDPQTWPYYGVGPLAGALIWDLARGSRLPKATVAVAAVEFAGQPLLGTHVGWVRLVLAAGCVVGVCRAQRDVVSAEATEGDAAPRRRKPVRAHVATT